MNYKDMIKAHIEFLYRDIEISESNQIRMFFCDKDISFDRYATSRDDALEIILKHRHKFNCFISLATTESDSGKIENQKERQVIVIDFDRKHFEQKGIPRNELDLSFFIDLLRKKTNLFYHAIVDSGNGYHCYFITEKTRDIDKISLLNQEINKLVDGDKQATLKTQVIRVAGTKNLKDSQNKKNVNLVVNNTVLSNFKRYDISKLNESIRPQESQNKSNLRVLNSMKKINMHCIDKMLQGVEQGERNFALGRITKALQVRGYTQAKAKQIVKEFNLRCNPPKAEQELIDDFMRFWENDYRLLGCYIKDTRKQGILKNYCSLYECEYRKNYDAGIEQEEQEQDKEKYLELMFDNRFLGVRYMRELKGNHYLILAMLLTDKENGLDTNELIKSLTPIKSDKPCIKKDNVYFILKELEQEGFILKEQSHDRRKPNRYKIIDNPSYTRGYTRTLFSVALLLINQVITQKHYLVYLYLLHHIQLGLTVDYDTMSQELEIDKGNISKLIKQMEEKNMIRVEKRTSERGLQYNYYRFLA